MIDVHIPTTDRRELVLTRYTQPEVDYHLRAGHGLFEPLAGHAVDAAFGRGGDDLVAPLRLEPFLLVK
jgi:hypothetical protein